MDQFSVTGRLTAGNEPVVGAQMLLVEAGRKNQPAQVVARTTSRGNGHYAFRGADPTRGRLLYTLALLPNRRGELQPNQVLAGVVEPGRKRHNELNINELTTVATAWSLNNFLDDNRIQGPKRSLRIAQAAYNNLVNSDGSLAQRLLIREAQETKATFLTLANIISGSVVGNKRDLNKLLSDAVDAQGQSASTTLDALRNLAQAPLNVSKQLFQLSKAAPAYSGALTSPPEAWVLPLVHFGRDKNGVKPINGPGNIAIDKKGELWISNNFTPFAPQGKPPFPGNTLIHLDSGGNLVNGEPVKGGGLYGAGYGIGIDPRGQIWVGNYGFGGKNAFTGEPALVPLRSNGNSVSRFGPQGQVRSPSGSKVPRRVPTGGITRGKMLGPQGTVSDQQGNIWIASNRETRKQDSKIVLYLDGRPNNRSNPRPYKHPSLSQPFDIAIDAEGDAWVAYTEGGRFNNGGVVELRYNQRSEKFESRTFSDRQYDGPWGIATSKNGDVWFTNNGERSGSKVSVINPERNINETFTLSPKKLGTWGINVDAQNNVYVTAFAQQSIYVLSGKNQRVGGRAIKRGELLSPEAGYRIPGVMLRGTAVELDPAGSLWFANNYQTRLRDYGGRNMIQYVGLGNPVDTPLIGPVAPLQKDPKATEGKKILFTVSSRITLGNTTVRQGDIALFNKVTGAYELFFDGSESGLKGTGIDAFDVLTGNKILMSFTKRVTLNGQTFNPADIVIYSAGKRKSDKQGDFRLFLDSSDVGLTQKGETINGLTQDLVTGDLLITTKGKFSAQGVKGSNRDVFRFQGDRLGKRTKGQWSLEQKGSRLGLKKPSEALDALSLNKNSLFVSTRGEYSLASLSGVGSDILKVSPPGRGSKQDATLETAFARLDRNNIIGADLI